LIKLDDNKLKNPEENKDEKEKEDNEINGS